MNLPNKLTVLRLLLVPVFMIFLVQDTFWAYPLALAVFALASFTDWLDGYLARRNKEVTTFGEFMDPLADKFLVSAAFICFVGIPNLKVPAWMVVLIIGREFLITGLRLVAISKGSVIAADRSGKFKTSSQIFTISVILIILCADAILKHNSSIGLLGVESLDFWIALTQKLSYWLTFGATLLTLISGFSYLRKNRHIFSQEVGLSN